jgi:hypothetical protein
VYPQVKCKSNANQTQTKRKSNANQTQIKRKSNANQTQVISQTTPAPGLRTHASQTQTKRKSNANQTQAKRKSNANQTQIISQTPLALGLRSHANQTQVICKSNANQTQTKCKSNANQMQIKRKPSCKPKAARTQTIRRFLAVALFRLEHQRPLLLHPVKDLYRIVDHVRPSRSAASGNVERLGARQTPGGDQIRDGDIAGRKEFLGCEWELVE